MGRKKIYVIPKLKKKQLYKECVRRMLEGKKNKKNKSATDKPVEQTLPVPVDSLLDLDCKKPISVAVTSVHSALTQNEKEKYISNDKGFVRQKSRKNVSEEFAYEIFFENDDLKKDPDSIQLEIDHNAIQDNDSNDIKIVKLENETSLSSYPDNVSSTDNLDLKISFDMTASPTTDEAPTSEENQKEAHERDERRELNLAVQSICDDIAGKTTLAHGDDDENIESFNTDRKTSPFLLSKCKIGSSEIFKKIHEILKDKVSPADEILSTELKNMWGRHYFQKSMPSKRDYLIQMALKEWNVWSMSSESRGPPVVYKCYICMHAWWHLEPFRNHLKKHRERNLSIFLETNFHECNMAACLGQKPKFKSNFKVDSDCWKCGNDYNFHRQPEGYKCETCSTSFFTCTDITKHVCSENKRKCTSIMYQCHLCNLILRSCFKFDHHCINFHSVRSDLPILSTGQICTSCDQYFPDAPSHHCPRPCYDSNLSKCEYCERKFPSPLMLEIHNRHSEKGFSCRVCGERLESQCMETMHIAKTHSEDFQILHKCILCEDNELFFKDSIEQHIDVWHKKDTIGTDFMEEVMVPKSFIRPEMIGHVRISCVNGKYSTVDVPNEKIKTERKDKEKKRQRSSGETEMVVTDNILSNEENDIDEIVKKKQKMQFNEKTINKPTRSLIQFENEYDDFNEDIMIKEENNPVEDNETHIYEDVLRKVFGTKPFGEYPKGFEPKLKPQEASQKKPDKIGKVINMKDPKTIVEPCLPSTSKTLKFCEKCGFKGTPIEYRKHNSHCLGYYHCTKCNGKFKILDHYVLHYTQHGYLENTCPDCSLHVDSNDGLVFHMQDHVRQCFSKTKDGGNDKEDAYVCRECKATVDVAMLFAHWESHLKLDPKKCASPKPCTENNEI